MLSIFYSPAAAAAALRCLLIKSAGGANFALETKFKTTLQKYNAARDAKRQKSCYHISKKRSEVCSTELGGGMIPAKARKCCSNSGWHLSLDTAASFLRATPLRMVALTPP